MLLSDWLYVLEQQRPMSTIKLGLERAYALAITLDLLELKPKVIIVAGTNGKGSTIATLEQLLLSHGKRVGTYTSPHLLLFNERIRLNGKMVDDQSIVNAFKCLQDTAGSKELTYYEWVTLAALIIFKQQPLDFILLEVGLGGRLDAVNIIDADVSIITSIDFDHMELLGDTLDKIAYEKAGVFRHKQHVFCGEPNPPKSLQLEALNHKVVFNQLGLTYVYEETNSDWHFTSKNIALSKLPFISLHLNNVCNALACFLSLGITSSEQSIRQSLNNVKISGRCQLIKGDFPLLFDVAHNRQSINNLCHFLMTMDHRCLIVFSMLKGKNIDDMVKLLTPFVKTWFVAPLDGSRSHSSSELKKVFEVYDNVHYFPTIDKAFQAAKKKQAKQQTLVISGSFLTVASVLESMAVSFKL